MRFVQTQEGIQYLVSQPCAVDSLGECVYVVAYRLPESTWFFQNTLNHEQQRLGGGDKKLGVRSVVDLRDVTVDEPFVNLSEQTRREFVREIGQALRLSGTCLEFEAFLFMADIDKVELRDVLINPIRQKCGIDTWKRHTEDVYVG